MAVPIPAGCSFSGDLGLLALPRRAILVSRTGRRPTPASSWVRATVEAVGRIVDAGEALVTGTGRDPYDLALVLCRRAIDGAAIVVLMKAPDPASLNGMLPARHLLVWPSPLPTAEAAAADARRDRLIGDLADRAFAVSIRPGGNMAAVASSLERRGLEVDRTFQKRALPRPDREEFPLPSDAPQPGAWSGLTHYTRDAEGAWPGEPREQFLDWLACGDPSARRGARDALRRILSTGRILASGRLMPMRTPMISLTERPPWEMREITRWMPSLRRWTFRPYGLAIDRSVMEALGARPVRYLPAEAIASLPTEARVFAQKHEPPETDWSKEAEWRLPGDLDLRALPAHAVRILVPTRAEADALTAEFGFDTLPIC